MAMGWLICLGIVAVALMYVAAEKTPIPEEHHNTQEDADHIITFRNRSVSMCKMRELEPEQMN